MSIFGKGKVLHEKILLFPVLRQEYPSRISSLKMEYHQHHLPSKSNCYQFKISIFAPTSIRIGVSRRISDETKQALDYFLTRTSSSYFCCISDFANGFDGRLRPLQVKIFIE